MSQINSEDFAFEIIACVTTARTCYIGAIDASIEDNIEEANRLMHEGREAFLKGHNAHAKLLQTTSIGKTVQLDLLLAHAEDQLMSAEAFGILAEKFIALQKKMSTK